MALCQFVPFAIIAPAFAGACVTLVLHRLGHRRLARYYQWLFGNWGGGRECGVTHQYYVLQFTRAGIFTRHWTAAPDKQMRLARTHTDHAAASAAAPQDWRSPSRAHVNPAAAKCKPHAHHSAKQENTDFQRARKLGQCHELVHHLLQQLAPRGHYALDTCAAARVSPLNEQPPGPSLDR
eukprot:scaffold34117_cov51-Phaeocystis_antarctica.AAC.2